jgi:D-sedoheptulose 7-phosphate isomerase
MSILTKGIQTAVETFQTLGKLEPQMNRAAGMVEKCLRDGHKLMVCGNGGSAGDASDFATEFNCRFMGDRRPYPALNLTTDGSLLTAIGNDYHFDEVFARQVWGHGSPGDLLVVISTSGKSRNVIRALEEAKHKNIESIAMLGRDGGIAKGMATVEFIVRCEVTARIQEAHKFLFHILCEMVEVNLPKS